MLNFPEGQREALLPYTPQFTIIVDDLSVVPDAELHHRALDAAARLSLLMLKHADGDLLAALAEASYLFGELLTAPNGRAAAERLIRYIMLVNESIDPKDIGGVLAPALGNSGEEIAMTVGHRLIDQGHRRGLAEGLEKGRAEGLEKGRVKGLADGKREALENLLQFKFGPLSAEIVAQIHSLDRARLDVCMVRIFSADSPGAVFR